MEGKKRLLTREQKNEILARMNMSFYMDDVAKGKLTMEDAMEGIKEAFNTKTEFEEMGYMLPEKKPPTHFGRMVLAKRTDSSATQAPTRATRSSSSGGSWVDATAPAGTGSGAAEGHQWQQHFFIDVSTQKEQ